MRLRRLVKYISSFWIAGLVLLAATAVWSAATHNVLSSAGGDSVIEHIGDLTWAARVFRTANLPLWNPYLYSGVDQPALAQTAVFYPINLGLYGLFPPLIAFNLSMVLHFLLAAYFMRRYLQTLGLSPRAVTLGALIFSCCGFMFVHKGLVPMFDATVWIPAVFFCVERWLRKGQWKYSLWGGACLALQLLSGWPQAVVLSGIYLVLYVFFALPQARNKLLFLLGIAALFAFSAALGMVQILPTLAFKQSSNLSQIPFWLYASNSYPPRLLLLLLFPFFFGADFPTLFAPLEWGPREFSVSTIYVGILPLMLALAALFLWRRSRHVRYASLLVPLSAYLALGTYTHYGRQLYHVPVYNFFRDHYEHFQFFAFGMATLAAVGFSSIAGEQINRRYGRALALAVPLTPISAAVFILLHAPAIVGGLHLENPGWPSLLSQTVSLRSPAVVVPILLIASSAVMFWLLVSSRRKRWSATLALALVALDLALVAVLAEPMPTRYEPTAAEAAILPLLRQATHENTRTLSLLSDTFFLRTNANQVAPYADILGFGSLTPYPYAELLSLDAAGGSLDRFELLVNHRILSLLNVRYVLLTAADFNKAASLLHVGDFTGAKPAESDAAATNLVHPQNWKAISSVESLGASNAFRSVKGEVHGVEQPVTLAAQTVYQLSFDYRADPGQVADLSIVLRSSNATRLFSLNPPMIGRDTRRYARLYVTGPEAGKSQLQFLSTSRTTLYVSNINLSRVPVPNNDSTYRVAARAGDFHVLENPQPLPRAFFVPQVRHVDSYADARAALWLVTDPLDLSQEALVEDTTRELPRHFDLGVVRELTYGQNEVRVRTSCAGACFLVVTDAYWPGWRATLDGRDTPIYRADGVVRGIAVPQGDHEIRFRYFPATYRLGFAISLLASALLIAVTVLSRTATAKKP